MMCVPLAPITFRPLIALIHCAPIARPLHYAHIALILHTRREQVQNNAGIFVSDDLDMPYPDKVEVWQMGDGVDWVDAPPGVHFQGIRAVSAEPIDDRITYRDYQVHTEGAEGFGFLSNSSFLRRILF